MINENYSGEPEIKEDEYLKELEIRKELEKYGERRLPCTHEKQE